MDLEMLRFPIGFYEAPQIITSEHLQLWIETIEQFPNQIEELTKNLTNEELNFKYRPEGWSIKQVVHHCADSHCNSFIRFKLAITEENPTIKPYMENLWAELIDGNDDDISASLQIIKGIHYKWVKLVKSFSNTDWEKTFYHPENKTNNSLKITLGLYAWHCEHHLTHIKNALNYKCS